MIFLDDAPPLPSAEQLAGDERKCYESAAIGDGTNDDAGILICALLEGHDGFLHWDSEDRIWWCAR